VNHAGIRVDPADWRALIARDDVVLIGNCNSFEYRVGHFKCAHNPGSTAGFKVGVPSSDWTGPISYSAYYDTIFNTYAFCRTDR
jgi:hypothetical protein